MESHGLASGSREQSFPLMVTQFLLLTAFFLRIIPYLLELGGGARCKAFYVLTSDWVPLRGPSCQAKGSSGPADGGPDPAIEELCSW
eukprot:1138161-Pelagomonas_calceolata.AAC.4